ncbi:hypothetical protein U9M48_016857, partial [Paspalum notatum var. saurae]
RRHQTTPCAPAWRTPPPAPAPRAVTACRDTAASARRDATAVASPARRLRLPGRGCRTAPHVASPALRPLTGRVEHLDLNRSRLVPMVRVLCPRPDAVPLHAVHGARSHGPVCLPSRSSLSAPLIICASGTISCL